MIDITVMHDPKGRTYIGDGIKADSDNLGEVLINYLKNIDKYNSLDRAKSIQIKLEKY